MVPTTEAQLAVLQSEMANLLHKSRNDRQKVELMAEEIDRLQQDAESLKARMKMALGLIVGGIPFVIYCLERVIKI